MRKILLLLLPLILVSLTLPAQKRYELKAEEAFERGAYPEAIKYYLKIWKKAEKKGKEEKLDPGVILNLADSYRLINDYDQSAIWLERAVALDSVPAITWFHYGHALLERELYDDARDAFWKYAEQAPDDPRGGNFLEIIDDLTNLNKANTFLRVEPFPHNTSFSEFGAVPYLDGIVFSAAREEGSAVVQVFEGLDQPFLDLYYSELLDDSTGEWKSPEPLQGDINTQWHESNFTGSDSTGKYLFSRNNYDGKKAGRSTENMILLKLYEVEMNGLQGGNIQEFSWNNDEYSITHPSLSPDGQKLYFSSDMPEGAGGKDLYVCEWLDDHWSVPRNLGDPVNTPGDEVFPFIHPDGTLYFSSDGHPGLGNLDVFSVDLTRVPVGEVRNLSVPVNSAYDDFGYTINKNRERAWFSSNRSDGAGNDDLYQIIYDMPEVELLVVDKVAQLPLENVRVEIKDSTGRDVRLLQTDSTGRVVTRLPQGQYMAFFSTEEFDPHFQPINTASESGENRFSFKVEMYNPPPAMVAVVVDDSSQQPIRNAEITFLRMTDNEAIVRTSDRNGRFAIQFDRNTTYQMMVKKDGYLNYKSIVSTSERAFDGDTIIPMKLEPIVINKPIVLNNINYDFDKWNIRPDAIPELHKLSEILKDNPQIRIELSSHTDSRGGEAYNQQLSQKRAKSCARFLVDLGVEEERIEYKGYGETKLLNNCVNESDCSEEEHERNRRTEFKIIGMIEGVEIINNGRKGGNEQ